MAPLPDASYFSSRPFSYFDATTNIRTRDGLTFWIASSIDFFRVSGGLSLSIGTGGCGPSPQAEETASNDSTARLMHLAAVADSFLLDIGLIRPFQVRGLML